MHMFFTKRFTGEVFFLVGVSLLFFLLRFPSLYEPYWYGDEGIYFTIGNALREGRMLYTEIWDNKPPLLYWFYFIFNDMFSIRFMSLLSGLASVFAFFLLSREFFRRIAAQYLSTILFAVIFALPSIEGNIANAENFMLFPIITAALFFWLGIKHLTKKEKNSQVDKFFFASGIFLGIAFLFKTVALFDFTAFLLFFIVITFKKRQAVLPQISVMMRTIFPYFKGFVIPFFATIIFFLFHGALPAYLETIFLGNIGYVGVKNELIIPQGLLLIKLCALVLVLLLLTRMKSLISQKSLFILFWLAFSVFNAFFSHRPYIHYQLVVISSLALAFGMLVNAQSMRQRIGIGLIFLSCVVLFYNAFPHWNAKKTTAYYRNFLSFVSSNKTFQEYQAFFDGNTPRDYEIADYLSLHRVPGEPLFFWGNSAQLYYLSETVPAGRFSVAYHIVTPEAIEETRKVLRETAPRFVVILPGTQQFPFILPEYHYKLSLGEADIYEKIN